MFGIQKKPKNGNFYINFTPGHQDPTIPGNMALPNKVVEYLCVWIRNILKEHIDKAPGLNNNNNSLTPENLASSKTEHSFGNASFVGYCPDSSEGIKEDLSDLEKYLNQTNPNNSSPSKSFFASLSSSQLQTESPPTSPSKAEDLQKEERDKLISECRSSLEFQRFTTILIVALRNLDIKSLYPELNEFKKRSKKDAPRRAT